MIEAVTAELNKKEPTRFHQKMLDHAKGLACMSRSAISKHFDDWDLQDEVFRGIRYLDSDDREQAKKGNPTKMVIPNTFAQAMTFTSFLFLMFNQNRTFFELMPSGDEDAGDKHRDQERILERDLRHNQWNGLLFQHLLDVSRFGPSILDCSWTRKISRAYVESTPTVVNYNNVTTEVRGGSEWREFVKYEGNQIRCISPYRFLPDLRHPLTDLQRGEFCGNEEEYSMAMLKDLEYAGEVAGIDHIEKFNAEGWKQRGLTRTIMELDTKSGFLAGPQSSQSPGTALVTKLQVRIVPSQFELDDDRKLGPETFPILYHIWYANDNRLIRCEPAMWWHDEFSYSVSQFTPDMHQTLNLGLADLIYRLQDVITWHINARITDVRRNMRGRLVIDPSGVETASLDGEGDIYLRKGAAKLGANRYVQPLVMGDVTQGHMNDADMLSKIMEVVTGVNGNAMGQYSSGRRSAQEARVVTAGAAGRMKMHGHLIWDSGIAPLGKKMLSNSRQGLSETEFRKAIGKDVDPGRYAQFKGTPEEVITGDDYFTFDSTLSSERGYIAQALQELLVAVVGNPIAAQQLDLDPRKLLAEIQYLRGAGNPSRFSLAKAVAAGAPALPPIPQPSVVR